MSSMDSWLPPLSDMRLSCLSRDRRPAARDADSRAAGVPSGGVPRRAAAAAPPTSVAASRIARDGATSGARSVYERRDLSRPARPALADTYGSGAVGGGRASEGRVGCGSSGGLVRAAPGTLSSTAHARCGRPSSREPAGSSSSGGASSSGTTSGSSTATATGVLKCDKCDGKHETQNCPWFKKDREKHPDARTLAQGKKLLGMQSGPVEVLRRDACRVIRQPGDGSCLYHSLSHGLRDGSTAHGLRRQIAAFIESNPSLEISDSPLKDWVLWDSGNSVATYCRRMAQGGVWGGGIEMAAVSHMKRVNVFVYQASAGGYKRISGFEASPSAGSKAVRVLYGGGVHYDALELTRR